MVQRACIAAPMMTLAVLCALGFPLDAAMNTIQARR